MWFSKKKDFDIPAQTVVKVLAVTTAFLAFLYLAYLARTILIWTMTAFFLTLALNPAVDRISELMPKKNRLAGTSAVFLALIAGLTLIGFLLIPPLVQQSDQLIQTVPAYADRVTDPDTRIGALVQRYNLIDEVRERQNELVRGLTGATGALANFLQGLFNSVLAGVTILTITFFMLLEAPMWVRRFWRMQPAAGRERNQRLAAQMYRAVSGYVNGKLLMAAIAAVATAIPLLILDVPYAIALSIIVGLLDLIPLIGATLGAIIVVTVAFFTSPFAAIVMAIFFAIYQQVENNVLQPVIFGKSVQISALLVTISILIGAAIGGILGALVAIPVTASIQILVKDLVSAHYQRQLELERTGKA